MFKDSTQQQKGKQEITCWGKIVKRFIIISVINS